MGNEVKERGLISGVVSSVRKGVLRRWQLLSKGMTLMDPRQKHASDYKEMLDTGKLELLTPAENLEQFRKIGELAEKVKTQLRPRPPGPK